MRTVVVTGANRGIGLGFVDAFLARGDRVFGTSRVPMAPRERYTTVRMEAGDEASIREAAADVARRTEVLDVLVHNAGIYSDVEALGSIGFAPMMEALRVNAVSPLVVTEAFLPLLRRSAAPRIVAITSGYGSIGANTGEFPYTYSVSKAALNQAMRCVAADLGPSGVITVLINPGWVRTDMGGAEGELSVEESVAGMLAVIDGLTPRDNGRFCSHLGEREPW